MTPDQKLAAFLAAEAPPARDPAFQATVAARIAARRAWMTVGALIPWTIAGTALMWGLRPFAGPLADGLAAAIGPSALVLAGAATTALVALWLARRFSAA